MRTSLAARPPADGCPSYDVGPPWMSTARGRVDSDRFRLLQASAPDPRTSTREGRPEGRPEKGDPMPPDDLLAETLRSRSHRFVAAGVDPNDLERIVDHVRTWDDWCPAWEAAGAAYED